MSDLRSLLEREAARAPLADDALERTLRRSTWRQRRRGMIIGAIAVAATAAVVVPLWLGFTGSHPVAPASPVPERHSVNTSDLRRDIISIARQRQRIQRAARHLCPLPG